jgi:hypothetical protein
MLRRWDEMMRVRRARAATRALMEAIGVTGLAAAAGHPGLLAALDQHAAEVRDSLFAEFRPLTPGLLSSYAAGVRDLAQQRGWQMPPVLDWTRPDWVLTRLLAVCWLARSCP